MSAAFRWWPQAPATLVSILGIVGLTASSGCGPDARRAEVATLSAAPEASEGRADGEASVSPTSQREGEPLDPHPACPSEAGVVDAEAELARRRQELREACRRHDPEACALTHRNGPPDARQDPLSASPAAEPFTIPRAEVEAALAEHDAEVRACYTLALRCDSSLDGRVTMRFAVDRYGRARHPLPQGSVEHPTLALCLRDILLLARFQPPDTIGVATVRHDFAPPEEEPPAGDDGADR